jgi:hypothetical protein
VLIQSYTLCEAQSLLSRHCDSYNRIPTLIDLWGACVVEQDDWLKLLGDEWSSSDNIGLHLDSLLDETPLGEVFAGYDKRHLMTDEEWEAFEKLPDAVTVFRGCYANNKWGLSWSLDRAVAEKFPTLHRYRQQGQPLLVKALACKADIAALKIEREEYEVITYRPRHISTSHIRGIK